MILLLLLLSYLIFSFSCYAQAFDASNSKRETTDKQIKVQGILRFLYAALIKALSCFLLAKNITRQPM